MKDLYAVQNLCIWNIEVIITVTIVVKGTDKILVHYIYKIAVDVYVLIHHAKQFADTFVFKTLGM